MFHQNLGLNKNQHRGLYEARRRKALVLTNARINQLSTKTRLSYTKAGFPASGPQIGAYPGLVEDKPVMDLLDFSDKSSPFLLTEKVSDNEIKREVENYLRTHDVEQEAKELFNVGKEVFNNLDEAVKFRRGAIHDNIAAKLKARRANHVRRISSAVATDKTVLNPVMVLMDTKVLNAPKSTAASIMNEVGSGKIGTKAMPFRNRPANVVAAMDEFQRAMKVRKEYRNRHTDEHKLRRSGRVIMVPDNFNETTYRVMTINAINAWNALAKAKFDNLDARGKVDAQIKMPVPPLPSYDDGKAFKDPILAEDVYEKKKARINLEGDEHVKRTKSKSRQGGFDKKMSRLGTALSGVTFASQIGGASALELSTSGPYHFYLVVVVAGIFVGYYLSRKFSYCQTTTEIDNDTLVSGDFQYDDDVIDLHSVSTDPLLASINGYGPKAKPFVTNAVKHAGQGGNSKVKRDPVPFEKDRVKAVEVLQRSENANTPGAIHARRRVRGKRGGAKAKAKATPVAVKDIGSLSDEVDAFLNDTKAKANPVVKDVGFLDNDVDEFLNDIESIVSGNHANRTAVVNLEAIAKVVPGYLVRKEGDVIDQTITKPFFGPILYHIGSGFVKPVVRDRAKVDRFIERLKVRDTYFAEKTLNHRFSDDTSWNNYWKYVVMIGVFEEFYMNMRRKIELLPETEVNRLNNWCARRRLTQRIFANATSSWEYLRGSILMELLETTEIAPSYSNDHSYQLIKFGAQLSHEFVDCKRTFIASMRLSNALHLKKVSDDAKNVYKRGLKTFSQENLSRFKVMLSNRSNLWVAYPRTLFAGCIHQINSGAYKSIPDACETINYGRERPCSPQGRIFAPPVSRCLFEGNELFQIVDGVNKVRTKIKINEHDMGGPWCGPACVTAGAGQKVSLELLSKRFTSNGVSMTCSTLNNVNEYAKEVGVNVLFKVYINGSYKYVSHENNKCFKWVVLVYREIDKVGHYLLGYDATRSSYVENIRFVDEFIDKQGARYWRPGDRLTPGYKIRRTGILVNSNNLDHRALMDSRDPVSGRGQDCLEVIRIKKAMYFGVGDGHGGMKYYGLKWPANYTVEDLTISKMRLAEALRAVQSAYDPESLEVALNVVDRSHGINTPALANGDSVIRNTKMVARLLAPAVERNSFRVQTNVHYNIPNDQCYADDKILETIAQNQKLGIQGMGKADGGDLPGINYISKMPGKLHIKTSRIVAHAPLGTVIAESGQVGPGLLPVTDNAGLISCISSRYIQRSLVSRDASLHRLFVKFAKAANFYLLEGLTVSAEPTLEESFRLVSEGKRSKDEVDLVLAQYQSYVDGTMTEREKRKFTRCSMFNKLEDNSKRIGSDFFNKHRGITTMSDEMAVIGSGIPLMSKFFFKGVANRFSIKESTPDEQIRKIMEVSQDEHMVTDFSSFEATFDLAQRSILGDLLLKFATKYNWPNLARSVPKLVTYSHLVIKSGELEAKLDALGSGLYVTALMGWCTNVLLGLFASVFADLRRRMPEEAITAYIEEAVIVNENLLRKYWCNLNVIMEGDDGLVRKNQSAPDVINRLGFKLSISQEGTKPGDCDFLSSRWMNGKRFLNVGKYLCRFLWVRTTQNLSLGKQLYILRCMAASLYHMSPGHPVLMALVEFIGEVTKHTNPFKNYRKYLDVYKFPGFDSKFPTDFTVDNSMRLDVAEGGAGFMGICLSDQYILEANFRKGHFYVGNIFDDDENVTKLIASAKSQFVRGGINNFEAILDALGYSHIQRCHVGI